MAWFNGLLLRSILHRPPRQEQGGLRGAARAQPKQMVSAWGGVGSSRIADLTMCGRAGVARLAGE